MVYIFLDYVFKTFLKKKTLRCMLRPPVVIDLKIIQRRYFYRTCSVSIATETLIFWEKVQIQVYRPL